MYVYMFGVLCERLVYTGRAGGGGGGPVGGGQSIKFAYVVEQAIMREYKVCLR